MQTGRNLIELATEVQRRSENSRDFIADTRQLTMKAGALAINGQGEFPLNENAHGQVAGHTQIPKAYYDRMKTEQPALLDQNVNTWLHSNPKPRMVRTLDNVGRGFLSDSYRPLDDADLLEAALPALQAAGIVIKSTQVTDRRLYIQGVTPKMEGEVKVGDPVQMGICISNSEVGAGSLWIATMIYHLICSNGMIMGKALRKAHLGKRVEIVEGAAEFYKDDTRRVDDAALFLKVRDTVAGVLSEENFQKHLLILQGAAERTIEGDPAKAVEVLAKKVGLTDGERGGMLRHLIEGGDLSAWGTANAVTRLAHDAANYDRSVELEQIGAQVVELPKSDWKAIAEAA